MFILDKEFLKQGKFDQYDVTNRKYIRDAGSTDAGGTYASEYWMGGISISADGNKIKWNRMADGTLIMTKVSSTTDGGGGQFASKNSYATKTYETVEAANDEYDPSNCYNVLTLGGGEYKVALARILSTTSDNAYEYWKYIKPTYGEYGWGEFSDYMGYEANNKGVTKLLNGSNVTTQFKLVATPTGAVPLMSPLETSLGVITEPKTVELRYNNSPALKVKIDDQAEEPIAGDGGTVSVDLSKWWESIGFGNHTIIVAAEQNGYRCGARIKFNKSTSVCSVTTKPATTPKRPVSVKFADKLVVPDGAVLTREVTNNANDEAPNWEKCDGDWHDFSNTSNTAGTWALAARVTIDNANGNGKAEIKNPITLAAIYEE